MTEGIIPFKPKKGSHRPNLLFTQFGSDKCSFRGEEICFSTGGFFFLFFLSVLGHVFL